ncbi:hypothetical protein HAPS_1201 [Glaesserella parasuis SH0165]|uniref:Uncharacterized protein n=1 Tax=Glaesserella parasuis serovar 5 (strain SH0165) TaxID=557723 RepID=B8F652_GLAP5|nr:hypothetical protein HAPS_1201 [Glaesserella parasuis SH0165]
MFTQAVSFLYHFVIKTTFLFFTFSKIIGILLAIFHSLLEIL